MKLKDVRKQIQNEIVAYRKKLAMLRDPWVRKHVALGLRAARLAKEKYPYTFVSSVGASIQLTVDELDGFKDARLTRVLNLLLNADEMSTNDHPDYGYRMYVFRHRNPDTGNRVSIEVTARLKSEPANCKVIVTSTRQKVVTEETKAFVCD